MNKTLNNLRFTVKPSISEGERALELARTIGVHPLTYQELPFDPEYSIYAGRLTPEKLSNATAEEMYWKVRRELIYADDVADASIFFLKKKTKDTIINIGTGIDRSINEYAKIIMKHFGVKLKIIHQKNKLIGTPRKLLCIDRLRKIGWAPKISLEHGLKQTITNYRDNH